MSDLRTKLSRLAGWAVLSIGVVPTSAQISTGAQNSTVPLPQHVSAAPIHAKLLLGLSGIDADSNGELTLSSTTLRFSTLGGHADIVRRRILSVSSGEERIETGGAPGRIARVVIPYGGGLVLGAVTHKKISLLTIEYLDPDGQYHGAVFLIASEDLTGPLQPLESDVTAMATSTDFHGAPCPIQDVQANTVRIKPIESDISSAFPPEDRVLLYENLVKKLQSEKTLAAVYRAGDRGMNSNCAEFTVTLRAVAFQKGDQAVRASVGPLGHFVGTTRLTYHLTITTHAGTAVLDRDLKASEGSDTDSLNITKVISKAVLKNLKKSRQRVHLSDPA